MRTALLCAVALLVAAPAADARDPKRATIKILSAKVRGKRSDGKAWDAGGGLPDLTVKVERVAKPRGDRFETRVVEDTADAEYEVRTIEVNVGDEVDVTVSDEDLTTNDLVGKTRVKITARMLKEGKDEWSFGEVLALKVKFIE